MLLLTTKLLLILHPLLMVLLYPLPMMLLPLLLISSQPEMSHAGATYATSPPDSFSLFFSIGGPELWGPVHIFQLSSSPGFHPQPSPGLVTP